MSGAVVEMKGSVVVVLAVDSVAVLGRWTPTTTAIIAVPFW